MFSDRKTKIHMTYIVSSHNPQVIDRKKAEGFHYSILMFAANAANKKNTPHPPKKNKTTTTKKNKLFFKNIFQGYHLSVKQFRPSQFKSGSKLFASRLPAGDTGRQRVKLLSYLKSIYDVLSEYLYIHYATYHVKKLANQRHLLA